MPNSAVPDNANVLVPSTPDSQPPHGSDAVRIVPIIPDSQPLIGLVPSSPNLIDNGEVTLGTGPVDTDLNEDPMK